ncbi:hypothetical protein FRAHR75_40054 [Frankia sp. Hr75.2]|nr:hypothetical protein FRAHR75_40054 [Frankia sp. Hr75.2]SQD98696.1 hypothetical protein FMEAI12_4860005 [Parafrankia sp. Ea1.12]
MRDIRNGRASAGQPGMAWQWSDDRRVTRHTSLLRVNVVGVSSGLGVRGRRGASRWRGPGRRRSRRPLSSGRSPERAIGPGHPLSLTPRGWYS